MAVPFPQKHFWPKVFETAQKSLFIETFSSQCLSKPLRCHFADTVLHPPGFETQGRVETFLADPTLRRLTCTEWPPQYWAGVKEVSQIPEFR